MGKNVEMLLDSVRDIWSSYDSHPFVMGIADGSLDKEKFKYYMIQDYLYLYDYARVFAIGSAKAVDPEAMKVFAGYVDQILNGEMEIHRGYMSRLGISLKEAESSKMALDNLSYTSYMLKVAYEGGAAETAASILSCAVSYEVIAKNILLRHPEAIDHEFYGEWISGYADPGYAAANRKLEALMEKLTSDMGESELERLKTIFINCSLYEKLFWDMAWEMRP